MEKALVGPQLERRSERDHALATHQVDVRASRTQAASCSMTRPARTHGSDSEMASETLVLVRLKSRGRVAAAWSPPDLRWPL